MELIGSGTYGCVYFPGFNCRGKIGKKPSNLVSKITTDQIGVDSEHAIGQIIKSRIPNYKSFFLIVEKKCTIQKGSLDNYVKSSCHLVNNHTKKYYVLYSPYVEGHDLLEFYTKDLKSQRNINKFYVNFFKYYDILCQSMIYLKTLNIVHFDLSLKNIRIETKSNRPLIIDFGMAIILDELVTQRSATNNITNFDVVMLKKYFSINPINSPKYCFEIQVICYIVMHHVKRLDNMLSNQDFTELLKAYYNSNQLFSLFSGQFKDKYIESIYHHYSDFIGKPIRQLVLYCLNTWKTWDSFNLHFHFISLLYNLDEFTPLVLHVMNLSMMQIHSNPKKRLAQEKVIDKYNNIIRTSKTDIIMEYMSSLKHMDKQKVKEEFRSSYKTLYA